MKQILLTLAALTSLGCGVEEAPSPQENVATDRQMLVHSCQGGCWYDGNKSRWLACEIPCTDDEKKKSESAL